MMHAPVVVVERRSGGFQPRDEAAHFVQEKMYPAAGFSSDSRPALQGAGTGNYSGDGRGNLCAQTHISVPMSMPSTMFSADAYGADIICSHKNIGNDLFLLDWPELGSLEGFEADLRKIDSPFELGSNYFDNPMWLSICSPDVQLVPSSHFDNEPNPSTVANQPVLLQPTVPVPDCAHEMEIANPINTQQPSSNKGRETPLNCSSLVDFPPLSEAHLLCPFDDMLLVPTSSSIMCSSSTLSGPDDIVSAYVPPRCCWTKRKSHATTPDMILDEMSKNPLEMYFPPLTTYEQPEVGTASRQEHHQLLPDGCFAPGGGAAASDGAGAVQLCSKGKRRRSCSQGSRESPEAAPPVKHSGFQKLQEGMNQMDVATKTCIRDALYRLAYNVEQRQCADHKALGSSGANRIKTSSVWAGTEGSSVSVAQLLLQKPLCRNEDD